MHIGELAAQSGVSTKTIRYYESIGLLPAPARATNNYRQYEPEAVERLRFIVSARSLGFTLNEIVAILTTRDQGIAPCDRVLHTLDEQIAALDQHIVNLLTLRDNLQRIRTLGAQLSRDDLIGDACVCALVRLYCVHGIA